MRNRCTRCEGGYVKKNGILTPCNHCITPDRFEITVEKAIKSCTHDAERKRVLLEIKNNLPEYPIMALMEAEHYGEFSKDFMSMLKRAYDIKPFMDVKYKNV